MYDSRALGRKEMCGKPWDDGRLLIASQSKMQI